jgi:hypothetical protein
MPLLRPFLLLVLFLLAATTFAADPGEDVARTALAHLLAFGRPGTAGATASSGTLAAQIERHRAELQTSAAAREHTARAAWFDAFGREPSAAELSAEAALPHTYPERLQRHLARLREHTDEYREVIHRAYRLVVHRDAYAEEFEYWRPHGIRSFVVLVACVEDWARRNRPGLMVTAGTPTVGARSRFVTILPLQPALAAEARTALAETTDSRVIAVSGARIATAGGVHVALVGRD